MKKFIKINSVILASSLVGFMSIVHTPIINMVSAEEIGDFGDATRMESMSFYSDPKTKMGFCWTTTNITNTNLQVMEKSVFDNSNGFDDPTVSRNVKHYDGTIEVSKIAGDGFIHRVNASNLTPDTKYVYRFGDESLNMWCETGSFKTAADSNRNFSFLHISDPQGDNELHYESYNQLLHEADKFNPEWVALTGDITDDSHFGKSIDLHEWELALTSQWEVFKNYPVETVSGNHDGAVNAIHSRYNNDYVEGSDTSTGEYYSFDYQGVHFTCINSNDTPNPKDPNTTGLSAAQMAWIEQDLAAHQNDKFLIAMMHKGMFDSGGHSANDDKADYDIIKMRQELAPLFTKYGVDLVLEGHDHLYSLSYPMVVDPYIGQEEYYHIDTDYKISRRDFGEYKDVYTFSNLKGTFYFNTGTASGQKYYAPIPGGPMEKTIFDTSNPNQKMFTMVDVLDNEILLRTYKCTSNETTLYKIYAIAKDSEGEDASEDTDRYPDLIIPEGLSFSYKFRRYDYEADVTLVSQKVLTAESNLIGKFYGEFSINGGRGTTSVKVMKSGKITVQNRLVFENETIEFDTTGTFSLGENETYKLSILDEKENPVEYVVGAKTNNVNVALIVTLSIVGGILLLLVIASAVVIPLVIVKKRKVRAK